MSLLVCLYLSTWTIIYVLLGFRAANGYNIQFVNSNYISLEKVKCKFPNE